MANASIQDQILDADEVVIARVEPTDCRSARLVLGGRYDGLSIFIENEFDYSVWLAYADGDFIMRGSGDLARDLERLAAI